MFATLSAVRNELDAQIVARIMGRDVPRGELSRAFDRVADCAHWKNPIDATIDVAGDFDLEVIREAVVFFAGCRPTFTPVRGGTLPGARYRVRAVGYYAAVGA
jgi:hypothetical protein